MAANAVKYEIDPWQVIRWGYGQASEPRFAAVEAEGRFGAIVLPWLLIDDAFGKLGLLKKVYTFVGTR